MQLPVQDKSLDRLPGYSASFAVIVPYVAQPADADEAPQQNELAKVNGGQTILFVEDEASIREMSTMYLEAQGYRVIAASNGAEAIVLWEKYVGEIDLVLTDLMMPEGVNGHQLVDRLRADRPEVRVIFVSGYSSDLLGANTFLEDGATFLQKPYRLKALAEMVQHVMSDSTAPASH